MKYIKVLKFAYRHTWGSGRLGFFRLLSTGRRVCCPTSEEIQLATVQIRSTSAAQNTVLHRLTQYNNHDGTNIFTAREPGLYDLTIPSSN